MNVYKIYVGVCIRPSFETYRGRVDLSLCGSNFRQIHTKMKLQLLIFGFLTHLPLLFSSILVLLKSCLQNCMIYNIAYCTVSKLLILDRGTVQNVQIFVPK